MVIFLFSIFHAGRRGTVMNFVKINNLRESVKSADGSFFSVQKIPQHRVSMLGENGLGMELYAVHR